MVLTIKRLIILFFAGCFLFLFSLAGFFAVIYFNLPKLDGLYDYKPLQVTEVYDRKGEKMGEFFRQKRRVIPYESIPKFVIFAFISGEDSTFFEHKGINVRAIFRSFLANLKAGRKVQGGSTITQQVAKTFLLSPRKTYIRKLKEIILSYRIESNLTKEEILYLYLNQIYFGQGAYGVAMAAEIYFRKPLEELSPSEITLLAGLPKAPSRYSPLSSPEESKKRQVYVVTRMQEEGYITEIEKQTMIKQPIRVYIHKPTSTADFFLETVRQHLVDVLGGKAILEEGIKIYTSLDIERQREAEKAVEKGLEEVSQKQGYRGPLKNINSAEQVAEFLLKERNRLIRSKMEYILLDYPLSYQKIADRPFKIAFSEEENLDDAMEEYLKIGDLVQGVVTKIDDEKGLAFVRVAETVALLDLGEMQWARKKDPTFHWYKSEVEKISDVLTRGDIIEAKIKAPTFQTQRLDEILQKESEKGNDDQEAGKNYKNYVHIELYQTPKVEAALLSIDQKTSQVISLVGGRDFSNSEYNRVLQAKRQVGSSFKPLVYIAALDKGYKPNSLIIDSPIIYQDDEKEEVEKLNTIDESFIEPEKEEKDIWKPSNYSNRFMGDVLFRTALIHSMNVPTIKILQDVSIDWVIRYSRRFGIFNALNKDFTLALGSSDLTLYEQTKMVSQINKLGKKVSPVFIEKVEDREGNLLLEKVSLDNLFEDSLKNQEEEIEEERERFVELVANTQIGGAAEGEESLANNESNISLEDKSFLKKAPPFYFQDPEQLINPQTAYLTTNLLSAVVREGTGRKALRLGRSVAGKTGTTNDYRDGWFLGYTPQITTGVWVGYDDNSTMGFALSGGNTALPIWIYYMEKAHRNLSREEFEVPSGIVFANIDRETGQLSSASSKQISRQAFIEGTEPKSSFQEGENKEDLDFFRNDLGN